jgi:hypothetical protein
LTQGVETGRAALWLVSPSRHFSDARWLAKTICYPRRLTRSNGILEVGFRSAGRGYSTLEKFFQNGIPLLTVRKAGHIISGVLVVGG